MHASTNVLTALASSRRGRDVQENDPRRNSRLEQRAADPPKATAPDYGCVEWYFYEERSGRRERS